MIVDIHAHYFPRAYNDTLLRIGGRSLPEAARATTRRPLRNDDHAQIATRLEQMDDAGVRMQVLSPAASPPYAEKEADAVEAARLVNDAYAELAQKFPGRFNAVVSLPLPHIDASLREMERGLDQLGMLGVSMTCSCFDRSTAEAEFEPLYAPAALLCAWKAFGADRLVAGSDYPVLMAFETYRQSFHYVYECGIPKTDADRILHHNSQIVLGLDRSLGGRETRPPSPPRSGPRVNRGPERVPRHGSVPRGAACAC